MRSTLKFVNKLTEYMEDFMRKIWIMVSLFLFLLVFIFGVQTILAYPVWNNSADFSGSRAFNSGINATGSWATNFTIEWEITQDPNTLNYTYTYTLNTVDPEISHFIVELVKDNNFWYYTDLPQTELKDWSQSSSNPDLPQGFYGLSFDDLSGKERVILSFTTDRAPVWGVFYAKGSSNAAAWSKALDLDNYKKGDDASFFIPRPHVVLIPEPTSIFLFGTGLLGLAGLGRKRLRTKGNSNK